jgi:hypothetical protein
VFYDRKEEEEEEEEEEELIVEGSEPSTELTLLSLPIPLVSCYCKRFNLTPIFTFLAYAYARTVDKHRFNTRGFGHHHHFDTTGGGEKSSLQTIQLISTRTETGLGQDLQ